jgi:gliding motility-associated-like protein
MKIKSTICLILLTGCLNSKAQNLVPNGSFENYTKLPVRILGEKIDSFISSWHAPTNGTPDYFNINAIPSSTLKPPLLSEFFRQNKFNKSCSVTCYPISGDAFAGFESGFNLLENKDTFRGNEYLQTELKEKLKKFHKYTVKFYVYNVPCNQLELPELGMFISSFQPKHYYIPDWSQPFNYKIATNFLETYTPQITVGEKSATKGEWVLIEKVFKSIDNEQYITIGNFSQSNFKIIPRDTVTERNVSYYFIDDVSVIEIPGIIAPDSACYKETITLQSGFAGPFAWYKNKVLFSTDSIVQITDTTNNWYHLHTPHGNDSLYLVIKPNPLLTAMNDTTICEGTQINLVANSNANSLIWLYNNLPTNTVANKSGKYVVFAQKNGCTAKDSVTLTAIANPQVSIADKQLCTANNEVIDVDLPQKYFYYWPQFNDSLAYRTIDSAGCFSILIHDTNYCIQNTQFCIEDVCAPKIFVPDAFVPNGINNTFKPVFSYVTETKWQIFNRWGQLVFQTNNTLNAWDGTFENKPCEAGLYLFTILYKGLDGKEKAEKSSVMLIR